MREPIRLYITAEGDTELQFVKNVLFEYLFLSKNVYCEVRKVATSKKLNKRGGMTTYAKAKEDIMRWMKNATREARFSTMFDFYSLPSDFPGLTEAKKKDPYQAVEHIEKSIQKDISDDRFIPYIQLYEFESLLFSGLDSFLSEYSGRSKQIEQLKNQLAQAPNGNPELINGKKETSPSHRISKLIPEYQKKSSGTLLARLITIDHIRTKCLHFNEWLTKLENLNNIIE